MAKMMDMMKQVRELKKMQKQLARSTVDFENAGITVKARGDMTVAEVKISDHVLANTTPDKLGRQITTAVNGALAGAKKEASTHMSGLMGGGGLGDLLGG